MLRALRWSCRRICPFDRTRQVHPQLLTTPSNRRLCSSTVCTHSHPSTGSYLWEECLDVSAQLAVAQFGDQALHVDRIGETFGQALTQAIRQENSGSGPLKVFPRLV